MNHPILPLNVPSSNHRIYPEVEMQRAIEKLAGQKLAGSVGYVEPPELDKAAFTAENFRIVHDSLIADITFADPAIAEMVKSGESVIRPAGFGQIADDGTVFDFTLTSLAVIAKDQDAFAKVPEAPKV